MRAHIRRIILLLLSCLSLSAAETGKEELEKAGHKYTDAEAKLAQESAQALALLRKEYADALAAQEKQALARNDFPLTLAVRDEKKRYAGSNAPATEAEHSSQPLVKALQSQFASRQAAVEAKLLKDRFTLIKSFTQYLETQENRLSQAGQVESAQLARKMNNEHQPVFDFLLEQMAGKPSGTPPPAPTPAVPALAPANPPITPGEAESSLLAWYAFDEDFPKPVRNQVATGPALTEAEALELRRGVSGTAALFSGKSHAQIENLNLDGRSFTIAFWLLLRVFEEPRANGILGLQGMQRPWDTGKWPGGKSDGKIPHLSLCAEASNALEVRMAGKGAVVKPEPLFNQWGHVAIRYDLSRRKLSLFLNGVAGKEAEQVEPLQGTSQLPIVLGCAVADREAIWTMSGGFDEVRIYGTALPDAQIQRLHQQGVASMRIPPKSQDDLQTLLTGSEWRWYSSTDFKGKTNTLVLKPGGSVWQNWDRENEWRWKAKSSRQFTLSRVGATTADEFSLAENLTTFTGRLSEPKVKDQGARSGKRVY